MEAYESMKQRLESTGLYALTGDTVVDFELKAYAEALNAAYDSVRELQAQSFVPTSSGSGLSLFEALFGLPTGEDTDSGRQAVLRLGAVTPGTCTKSVLETTLAAIGLDVSIEEQSANQKLIVHFLKAPGISQEEAVKKLEIFLPAHLTVESDFTAVS